MGRLSWGVAAFVGALTLVVACTEDDSAEPEPTDTSAPQSDPVLPEPTESTAEPQPAIVVNVHRGALDLTESQAERLIAGSPLAWRSLGQPGGDARVVTGPRAVDRVERDLDAIGIVMAAQVGPTVRLVTVDGTDPIRSPRRYPLGEPPVDPAPVTSVTIVGDIMMARRLATPNGPSAALRAMSDQLAAADLTVGNLESTLSDDGAPTQDDAFAADPSALRALDRAGFDLVSLANNHTGDFGRQALLQTMASIDDSPVRRVGAGRDAREAWRPTILERNGVRFGFLAFNAIGETPRATRTSPGAAEIRMQPRTGPLDTGDLAAAQRRIRSLKERADVVIVLPHWGDQYTHQPVPDQRRVGGALVDAGADIVVGGHPHWVQGVQVRRDAMIVQSLGNFVFDMDIALPGTREGITANLTFAADRLVQMDLEPYVIGAAFGPRPVDGARGAAILGDVWRSSDRPFAPVR